jgi:hypothetical protein
MTVGGFGVHALLDQLQQLQHIGAGVDGVPIRTRLQAITYGAGTLSKHQGKHFGLYRRPLVCLLNIFGVLKLVLFFVNPRWLIRAWCVGRGRGRRQSGESQADHGQAKVTSTLNGAGHMFGDFFCCLGEQVVVAVGQSDVINKTMKVGGLSLERTTSGVVVVIIIIAAATTTIA